MSKLPAILHPEIFERVSTIHMFDCDADDRMIDLASKFAGLRYLQIPENAISEQALQNFRSLHPRTKIVVGLIDEDLN